MDWEERLGALSIALPLPEIRNRSAESDLQRIKQRLNTVPQSYLDFCTQIGAGSLGERIRIFAPRNDDDIHGKPSPWLKKRGLVFGDLSSTSEGESYGQLVFMRGQGEKVYCAPKLENPALLAESFEVFLCSALAGDNDKVGPVLATRFLSWTELKQPKPKPKPVSNMHYPDIETIETRYKVKVSQVYKDFVANDLKSYNQKQAARLPVGNSPKKLRFDDPKLYTLWDELAASYPDYIPLARPGRSSALILIALNNANGAVYQLDTKERGDPFHVAWNLADFLDSLE